MKDKACCYDCLFLKNERGIKTCKKTKKEIVNPFDKPVCERFKCFQCTKQGKEECQCYSNL